MTISPGVFIVNTAFRKSYAVEVTNANKRYGAGKVLLDHFNMSVERGSIYTLLGSSGCGKTTLLSCVVGLKSLDKGDVQIFGAKPGTPESGVPGKRIGYMPQEIALNEGFTIKEAMLYFGRLMSMSHKQIMDKMTFLSDLLHLPEPGRYIKTLSGGEQRRVSFAVTMIHDPELLILDEPTVGVDPLLRKSIWDHLCKLVRDERPRTVIITTHYVEEARQASRIGVMRSGRLLAEDSPSNLMFRFNTSFLEEIVLKLSHKDGLERGEQLSGGETPNSYGFNSNKLPEVVNTNAIRPASQQGQENEDAIEDETGSRKSRASWRSFMAHQHNNAGELTICQFKGHYDELMEAVLSHAGSTRASDHLVRSGQTNYSGKNYQSKRLDRILAMSWKNFLILFRNLPFLVFVFCLPTLNVVIMCLAVGPDPRLLNFGVINREVPEGPCDILPGCEVEQLSCRFLKLLPPEVIIQIPFKKEEDAIEAVKKGKLWGYIAFADEFSDRFFERVMGTDKRVSKSTLRLSRIRVRMDLSNKQIGGTIKRIMFESFKTFGETLLKDCDYDPEDFNIPLHFEPPLYGSDDTTFKDFIAPSVMLGIVFFSTVTSAGLMYITERKEGMLDRSFVAGVTVTDVYISYCGPQVFILTSQITMVYHFLVYFFDIPILGEWYWAVLLTYVVGFSGVSLGFLLSAVCTEERTAIQLAMGMFMPNMLLAGMLWPVEALPGWLQWVSYCLPCTWSCEAIRSVFIRGWGITHPNVYYGFITTSIWTSLYWFLTVAIHQRKWNKR